MYKVIFLKQTISLKFITFDQFFYEKNWHKLKTSFNLSEQFRKKFSKSFIIYNLLFITIRSYFSLRKSSI